MFIYNNIFKNDEQIRLFVENSERNYKNQVLKIAIEISELDHIKFLTLSGPTCSGKTTTSYILEQEFEKRGSTVKIISIDDFYRNRNDISGDEKPDYESISAIDFPIFESCVNKILKGETAMLPIYDFKDGKRMGFVPYTPVEHEIIIFEGIQAIYPEILNILIFTWLIELCYITRWTHSSIPIFIPYQSVIIIKYNIKILLTDIS